MNRKQRRAAEKSGRPTSLEELLRDASLHQANGRMLDAARHYERALELAPGHGELLNNLGCAYLALGKLNDAAVTFAKVIEAKPEVLDDIQGTVGLLHSVAPSLRGAVEKSLAAWPRLLAREELFDDASFAAVAANPLLQTLLRSGKLCDVGCERLFTNLRQDFVSGANSDEPRNGSHINFYAALAEQCFITEYVYATTDEELSALHRTQEKIATALDGETPIGDDELLACAMYASLSAIPQPERLTRRKFSSAAKAVVTQQIEEPAQELALRDTIPALTPIEDAVSRDVQQQYEDNPYPRYGGISADRHELSLTAYLNRIIPSARFAPPPDRPLEMLIAGCGTGRQAIETAANVAGLNLLAIDLSRASLAHAKRKTPTDLAPRIDYAQADILALGTIGRSFDVVAAVGVLHHMQNPVAAWRGLAALVRPNGFMHLGFYSETARALVVAARSFIAERGYPPTAAGIRQCRQDILAREDFAALARWSDFYNTSECRDLLFHVQEQRFTIPKIKAALDELGLRFLGFVLNPPDVPRWQQTFRDRSWSMSDLDRWETIERDQPNLFLGMYQFWVQKPDVN